MSSRKQNKLRAKSNANEQPEQVAPTQGPSVTVPSVQTGSVSDQRGAIGGLVDQLKQLSLASKPPRPTGVKYGNVKPVKTNCFRMAIPADCRPYLSKVVLKKKDRLQDLWFDVKAKTEVKLVMAKFQQIVRDLPWDRCFFDGKDVLWSYGQSLGEQNFLERFALSSNDEVKDFQLQISSADNTNVSSQTTQFWDVVMNDYFNKKGYIAKGVKVFDPTTGRRLNNSPNLSLVFGVFKSARIYKDSLMVMVDCSTAYVQTGGRLEAIIDRIRQFYGRDFNARVLLDELKGFSVKQVVGGSRRPFRIEQFSRVTPFEAEFDWLKEGEEVPTKTTVAAYFREKHHYQLKNRNLPCLVIRKPQGDSILVPAEVCEILDGQIFEKRISPKLHEETIELSRMDPPRRYSETLNWVKNHLASAIAKVTGARLSVEPIQVEATILANPNMKDVKWRYANAPEYNFIKFATTVPLDNWAAVEVIFNGQRNNTKQVEEVLASLQDKAAGNFNWRTFKKHSSLDTLALDRYSVTQVGGPMEKKVREFVDFQKKRGMKLIFWAIPNQCDKLYECIKYICKQAGVASQCFNMRNIRKAASFTFTKNLLLKMNIKNGGTNVTMAKPWMPRQLAGRKIMAVGMDVYHPGIGERDKPSIAAFVASFDDELLRYKSSARIQQRTGQEEVSDQMLETAMVTFLDIFKKENGCLPDAILFFRDGVSAGQLPMVREREVPQIYKAYNRLASKPVQLTYVTIQKRNHFRMYLYDPAKPLANPAPGTLVDQDVVHPHRFEFYLNSHEGIIGTSKPTHQTVVVNDSKLGWEDMQKLSYYISWMSARCTKPISVPVPAQYAHLVAERANLLLRASNRSVEEIDLLEQIIAIETGDQLPMSFA